MAWAQTVWVYPGGFVLVDIDAQDRVRAAQVVVPAGYIGHVRISDPDGSNYNADYPAGTTDVPFQKPIPQDTGYVVGMNLEKLPTT